MTLLIKNVILVGAEHSHAGGFDVFVAGERVSAIGRFPHKGADEVVDGGGAYLSPGFIDAHTESDHSLGLLAHPSQEYFLRQGVTTIIGGHDGVSLAPLLYGGLEAFEEWAHVSRKSVDWHTTKEFFAHLAKRRLGVNFVGLVGHRSVRDAITGGESRNLTKRELPVLERVIRRAFLEGASGVSLDMGPRMRDAVAPLELKLVAQLAKQHNGVCAFSAAGGASLLSTSADAIRLAKETGVRALVSHFSPAHEEEKNFSGLLDAVSDPGAGVAFYFDVSPTGADPVPLSSFLPHWISRLTRKEILAHLHDEWMQKKIAHEFAAVSPEDFLVIEAPENAPLAGRTLAEVMQLYEIKNAKSALIKLMRMSGLRAFVSYPRIRGADLRKALAHPHSLVSSYGTATERGPFAHRAEHRALPAAFPGFLDRAAKEELLPRELAIEKITKRVARFFGLHGRGEIAEGSVADLTAWGERGIKFVAVNGRVAMLDGEFRGAFAGRPLA